MIPLVAAGLATMALWIGAPLLRHPERPLWPLVGGASGRPPAAHPVVAAGPGHAG